LLLNYRRLERISFESSSTCLTPPVRHDIPVRGFALDVKTGRVHEVARKPKARTAGA
jgi:hypothetical protein